MKGRYWQLNCQHIIIYWENNFWLQLQGIRRGRLPWGCVLLSAALGVEDREQADETLLIDCDLIFLKNCKIGYIFTAVLSQK